MVSGQNIMRWMNVVKRIYKLSIFFFRIAFIIVLCTLKLMNNFFKVIHQFIHLCIKASLELLVLMHQHKLETRNFWTTCFKYKSDMVCNQGENIRYMNYIRISIACSFHIENLFLGILKLISTQFLKLHYGRFFLFCGLYQMYIS